MTDDREGDATATVTVTVNEPLNRAPVAVADAATTLPDVAVTVSVLANDSDPEGDTLAIASVTQPAAGTGTAAVFGEAITYTPPAGWTGTAMFTYTVTDSALTAVGTVTVTVNTPPVAVADAATTQQDVAVTVSVLANDTDADDHALEVSAVVTQPAAGTGTAAVSTDAQGVTYTPPAGWSGEATFSYRVTDALGGTAEATVTMSVNGTPVAVADAATTQQDVAVTVPVLSNDTDPDGDPLAVSAVVTQPAASTGTAAVSADAQTVTYTPPADWSGEATFTYQVSDGRGGTAEATVTVSVNGTPVAVDDVAETQQDVAVTVSVLANDTDPDDDPLAVAALVTLAGTGTVAITDDGQAVTYTPPAGWWGEATFTYQVSDGRGGTAEAAVTVTVNGTPVAVDDAATTLPDVAVTVAVLANDTDPDGDPLAVDAVVTQPAAGAGTAAVSAGAQAVTYTPATGWTGTATFTYRVRDDRGGTAEATVTVTVRENGAPVAVDDVATMRQDRTLTVSVLANDTDPDGDPLAVDAVVTQPAAGTGTAAVSADAQGVVYTPAAGWTGTATFSYRVSDGRGGTDEAAVTVTVRPPTPFTDPVLTPKVTPIKVVHMTELRTRANGVRVVCGLTAAVWTDPVLTARETPIKAAHRTELRTALAAAHTACGQAAPVWTDPVLTVGETPIKAAHVLEYAAEIRRIFADLSTATERHREHGEATHLKLVAVEVVAEKWLMPRLANFRAAHPDISIEFETDHREVDLDRRNFDVWIAFTDRVDETLQVETLFEETLLPVCSPIFLKTRGRPREPSDLHRWPLLYDLHWTTYWSHWFAHHGAKEADLSRASGFRLYSMMVQAAVEGMGVALGHSLMIARELEQGTLVSLFDSRVTAPARYLLVTAPASAKKPQVRAFRHWVLHQAGGRSPHEQIGASSRGPSDAGAAPDVEPGKRRDSKANE